MIEYRSFHNTDPPRIAAIWNAGQLGRGAASGLGTDAFETVVFSQSYFERDGLILALHDGEPAGFVHAGFGTVEDGSRLDYSRGVICAVVVLPGFRRQGIGSELLRRAEEWLVSRGVTSITAGPAADSDPFYMGIYGGTRLSGFLQSDVAAEPFLTAAGYQPATRTHILQRDLVSSRDPVSMRLVGIRRKTQLGVLHQPSRATWWWFARFGRLDTIEFILTPRNAEEPVASMTVLGLDYYLNCWGERVVGLTGLEVPDDHRRQGFAQALVLDACRRLKEETFTRAEAHCPESNPAFLTLLHSAGFAEVDTGIVYRKTETR